MSRDILATLCVVDACSLSELNENFLIGKKSHFKPHVFLFFYPPLGGGGLGQKQMWMNPLFLTLPLAYLPCKQPLFSFFPLLDLKLILALLRVDTLQGKDFFEATDKDKKFKPSSHIFSIDLEDIPYYQIDSFYFVGYQP